MSNCGWLKDAVIYHIFLDRFAGFDKEKDDSKPERIGGNIRGIIKKIPYFKKLGVDCIWISPFYKSTSYHGYDIEDFYKIDENVGTELDLKELINKSHRNGIRVIADFVPNHCSVNHPFFVDAKNNASSKYKSWFYFKNWPNEYLCFLNWKNLPKINLNNKDAREYIINAALYWLNLGLDGFRIDHAIGPEKDFLKELKIKVKGTLLIGEVWFFGINLEHAETIKAIKIEEVMKKSLKNNTTIEDETIKQLDVLDGFLDFTFNSLLKDYLKGKYSGEEFFRKLELHYKSLDFLMPSFLDNHDMNRLIFELGKDKSLMKIASVLQFSTSQPPIIYYGDETGLSQAISIEDMPVHGDLQARRRMNWEEIDEDLFKHYQRLCILRKKIKALKTGEMKLVYADNKSRFLVFTKESEDRVLVILNPDNVKVTFNLELKQINARYLIDLFENVKIDKEKMRMEIEPKSFKMFFLK
ncbi:MAG: alpha-amylase family glycosyl hydrolase [Candidatus Aenigmatarchaeota archaeon]